MRWTQGLPRISTPLPPGLRPGLRGSWQCWALLGWAVCGSSRGVSHGPGSAMVLLLKCQPLSVPRTEPTHVAPSASLGPPMRCSLSSKKPHGTNWAGKTFYLATCSRGRIRALLSFQQRGGEVQELGGGSEYSLSHREPGLGMEGDRRSLNPPPHSCFAHTNHGSQNENPVLPPPVLGYCAQDSRGLLETPTPIWLLRLH